MTSKPIHAAKPNAVLEIFGRPKVVIGVVHAKALPGSPAYGGEPLAEIYDHAVAEA